MKTQYRILWVDDEIETVETDIADIKEFFERYGIEANIIEFRSGPDTFIHEDIKNELENPEIDLIVVDFLMGGMDGSDLIKAIRATDHIFLPVVFYSTIGPEELHKKAAESSLDGVYISHRDNVRVKIEEVATSLLRKEQTSKRTRGLLMEGVSELDANFGTIFLSLWDQLDEGQQEKLVAYFKKKLTEKSVKTDELIKSLPNNLPGFRAEMESNFVSICYDTITRWKILKKLFGLLGITGNEVDIFHRLFIIRNNVKPLIQMRNDYAHKTRSELEEVHDEAVCKTIRSEIRSQMQNTLVDIPNMLNGR